MGKVCQHYIVSMCVHRVEFERMQTDSVFRVHGQIGHFTYFYPCILNVSTNQIRVFSGYVQYEIGHVKVGSVRDIVQEQFEIENRIVKGLDRIVPHDSNRFPGSRRHSGGNRTRPIRIQPEHVVPIEKFGWIHIHNLGHSHLCMLLYCDGFFQSSVNGYRNFFRNTVFQHRAILRLIPYTNIVHIHVFVVWNGGRQR